MTLNIHSNLRTEEGLPHNQYSSSLIVQSFFVSIFEGRIWQYSSNTCYNRLGQLRANFKAKY